MTPTVVYETPRGDRAVDIDGIRFLLEDLDPVRLMAELAKLAEEETELRLMETTNQDPGAQHWKHKADVCAAEQDKLRALIREKREFDRDD
jgi:hypothetical protein